MAFPPRRLIDVHDSRAKLMQNLVATVRNFCSAQIEQGSRWAWPTALLRAEVGVNPLPVAVFPRAADTFLSKRSPLL